MPTERITFPGALGKDLAARLERPPGEPVAWAVFAHCFTCSKDLKAAVRITRTLARRGFAVLRFDFTGLGESEGDFADTDFSSNVGDLVAAADFLRSTHGPPRLLVGHSLGGAAVLAAAGRVPDAEAVATLAAPSDTGHLVHTILERAPELAARDEAEVELAGRTFRVRRELLEDLRERRLLDCVRDLGRPLLLFHSPVDEVVGIDHARRLYEAARHPKSFISLDGADHLLLRRQGDAAFVGEVLAAWASRYVTGGEAEVEPVLEPGEVLVEGGLGLTNRVFVRSHRLLADEPLSDGGEDAGPNPYEYLLAALGACTSMTSRLYADRKKWPLEGTRVRLRHARIHAEDCGDCETREGKLDEIHVEVAFEGPLSEDQLARLTEIAGRCPVHRTLTSEIKVRLRRVGSAPSG